LLWYPFYPAVDAVASAAESHPVSQ